jgi:hypothetical protein
MVEIQFPKGAFRTLRQHQIGKSSHPAHCEQTITKNFHVDFKLLLQLKALRQPGFPKEKAMAA